MIFSEIPTILHISLTAAFSRLAAPASLFVSLPVGHLKTGRFCLGPMRARGLKRIGIFAIEQQDQTLVGRGIVGDGRAFDEKPHRRAVGIVAVEVSRMGCSAASASRQVPCGRKLSSRQVHRCASSASMRSSEDA